MAQTYPHLHFVILCDDYGAKLWPVARAQAPACLAPAEPGSNESLLSSLASHLVPHSSEQLHIITTNDLRDVVSSELISHAGLDASQFEVLIPPAQRGSAFSVALAAAHIRQRDPNAVLAIFPSTLHIASYDRWEGALYRAYQVAALRDHVALLGALQEKQCAGVSFIRPAVQFENIEGTFNIRELVFDAREITAKRAVREGASWYTGVFFSRATVLLGALANVPHITRDVTVQQANRLADVANFLSLVDERRWSEKEARELVEALPQLSYEQAVLAPSDDLVVVPADVGFDSVTSLDDLDFAVAPDENGNREIGNALALNSAQTTVYGEGTTRHITAYGLENVLVVDTPDALLVADKTELASESDLLAELERTGVDQLTSSARRIFSWGTATLLCTGEDMAAWRMEIREEGTFDTLTLADEYGLLPEERSGGKANVREQYVVASGAVSVFPASGNGGKKKYRAGNAFSPRGLAPVQVFCDRGKPATLILTAVFAS